MRLESRAVMAMVNASMAYARTGEKEKDRIEISVAEFYDMA